MYEEYTFGLDRAIVFNGIGSFGNTLKELLIDGPCTYYFSLTTLLGLLPALTHLMIKLTYLGSIMDFEANESMNEESRRNIRSDNDDNSNNDEMYNLVFLSLHSEDRRNTHIKQIVKRCPRLKYLLVSSTVLIENAELSYVDFASIHKLCPSIHYVHWGEGTVTENIEKEWLTLSRRERGYTDNENTSNYRNREATYLRRVRFCSEDEEQHLSILKSCLQQPSLLEHLRLSSWCDVCLHHLWNSFTRRICNLLSQFLQLKSLELVNFCIPHQTENNIFFENLFSHFQHIGRLRMKLLVTPLDNVDDERNSISKLFEAIGHQLHHLKHLSIDLLTDNNFNTQMALPSNLFTALCDGNQELEVLHLDNVPISNDMLLDLCYHPKLRTLSFSGYDLHKNLTKDGWISFARKLKEQEEYSNGRIWSILVSCSACDDVTDEVLEELAGVKSLNYLRVVGNKKITDAGINKFASTNGSSSEEQRIIVVDLCDNVSLDNPHVEFLYSRDY